jgi:CheY-like chemotaxis protein
MYLNLMAPLIDKYVHCLAGSLIPINLLYVGKYILLIDDDNDDARTFSDALEEIGADMTVAHYNSGWTALEALTNQAERTPDVIFLDVNMPNLSGWDCLRSIKALASMKQTPIIMYSTANLEKQGVTASDVGAAAFLVKPTRFEELKNKLSEVLSSLW